MLKITRLYILRVIDFNFFFFSGRLKKIFFRLILGLIYERTFEKELSLLFNAITWLDIGIFWGKFQQL